MSIEQESQVYFFPFMRNERDYSIQDLNKRLENLKSSPSTQDIPSDEILLQRLQKLTGHPPISSIPYQSQPTKTPTKPIDQDLLNELLNDDTLLTGVIDQSYEETNLSVPETPLGKRYSGKFIDYTTLALTSPESASIVDWEADLLVSKVQEEVALEKKYGTVIEDSESGLSDKTSEGSESSDSNDGSENSNGSSDIVKSD